MKDTSILGVKVWRQKKGISLQTIAASTKLSVCVSSRRLRPAISRGFPAASPQHQLHPAVRACHRSFDEADLIAFYQQCCNPAQAVSAEAQRQPSRTSRLLFQPWNIRYTIFFVLKLHLLAVIAVIGIANGVCSVRAEVLKLLRSNQTPPMKRACPADFSLGGRYHITNYTLRSLVTAAYFEYTGKPYGPSLFGPCANNSA